MCGFLDLLAASQAEPCFWGWHFPNPLWNHEKLDYFWFIIAELSLSYTTTNCDVLTIQTKIWRLQIWENKNCVFDEHKKINEKIKTHLGVERSVRKNNRAGNVSVGNWIIIKKRKNPWTLLLLKNVGMLLRQCFLKVNPISFNSIWYRFDKKGSTTWIK